MSKTTKSYCMLKMRLNHPFASILAILLLMLISVGAKSTPITFFDGDFNTEDWESFLASKDPSYATIEFGKSQILTGGTPDAYLYMWHGHNYIYSSGVVFYWNNKISYDPSIDGAILEIDYSANIYRASGATGNLADGLILWQADSWFYSSRYNYFDTQGGIWQNSLISNLKSDDFININGGTLKPDFSSSGSPIQFGYFRHTYVDSFYNGGGMYHGIDNWRIEITHTSPPSESIPEPGTVGLLGLGLAGLICLGRKRRYF